MTRLPITYDQAAAYRASVERHLADLPDHVRAELSAGMRGHIARAAAWLGPDEPLERRLGSPEAYARHLRATVELQRTGLAARVRRGLGERIRRATGPRPRPTR